MKWNELAREVANQLIELRLLPPNYQAGAEKIVKVVNDAIFAYGIDLYSPNLKSRKQKFIAPIMDYKKWLKRVAEYYHVQPEKIIARNHNPDIVRARQTFLWVCMYEGIDIYKLAEILGRKRTTFYGIMRQGFHNRNLSDEFKIRFNNENQQDDGIRNIPVGGGYKEVLQRTGS